ncbi:hypothetical protein BE21_26080 [Sorangium cellulosum]|uniref:DUF4347 domain-containing protein n=1 Tax=Sorangium cellulosum TaxID=56 RepID=A0A150TTX1_SORCE|nr:hypothetical protein BE21_26080 [Sorangium cellulosum]
MAIHLLVVGEPAQPDPSTSQISDAADLARPTETFKVVRCASPRALVGTVRGVVRSSFQKVDVLDLFDHGRPGCQEMGDGVLFDHQGAGQDIAHELRPLLTADARVRLLGCETALGHAGQRLLQILAAGFGGSIVVYGTTSLVQAGDPVHHEFDAHGFKKDREEAFLFSSTEAATRLMPSRDARDAEILAWYASLGPP